MNENGGTLRWSTSDVGGKDSFAYWRESLSANLIGMTPEAAPEDREGFEGEIKRIPAGDTALMQLDMKLSRLRMDRSRAEIRAAPGDGVFLYRGYSSDMNFLFHDRDHFVPHPGTTVIGGLDRERYSIVSQPGRYRCEVLRIPAAALKGIVYEPSRLEPRPVDRSTGPAALLHDFFASFLRELPRLTNIERTDAVATLTDLVTLSLRRDRAGDEPIRDAVRAARLRRIQNYVRRHAASPDLSPSSTAQAMRISVRQLHALFEPGGKSFSRFLAEYRIQLALDQLRSGAAHTITEIALINGFDSLSTFYRAFRTVTGTSPQKERARQRG